LLIIGITIGIAIFSKRFITSTAEFFVAGRKISAVQNAFAMSGDYMSAASFLGIAGLVWLYGYDGIWYAAGFFGGWVILLLFLASPIRRFGAYTVADFVAERFKSERLRIVATLGTLLISVFYMVPQMVGTGDVLSVLLGWDYTMAVIISGVLITGYVMVGGIRATTYNSIVQCVVLWTAMFVTVILALSRYGFSYGSLLAEVTEYTYPGKWLDFTNSFALILGLILGTAGLPHILVRYYTNPSGRAARMTTVGALFILGSFYIMSPIAGFATRAFLGANAGQNTALPLLAEVVGGEALMGIVCAGAFAAILSTVAGLILTSTGALAHDFYMHFINRNASEEKQLKIAKLSAGVIGIFSIFTGIIFRGYNVAFLVGLAFSIAASTFFPVLFMGFWWRGMTEKGALAGLLIGMISSISMIATNLLGLHALTNPSIISVPLAFLSIYLVSKADGKVPSNVDEFMYKVHIGERE